MSDMENELETPWGVAQSAVELAPGILKVTTEVHGGFRLSNERRKVMLDRMGFEFEWFEEDDEGRIVEGVFAAELGFEDGEDRLKQVPEELLALMRQQYEESQLEAEVQVKGNLQAFLLQKDAFLSESADADIPVRERLAFVLGSKVTPEPESAHNLDWLIREATQQAKFIHLEVEAGMAIFVFRDRSILAALQNGMIFGVPTGSPANVEKLIGWLAGQGVTERDSSAKL
jgi:hypothetical protein